ncbi:MAG: LysR family transcriptional regulator [Roseobacter sp.]
MSNTDTSSIDVKLLRTFLAVFETGSVTKAAESLKTSQSATSHNLERLRRCIGDPLFVKSGRGIRPTQTAVAIAGRVSEIVTSIDGLPLQADYHACDDTTEFTIATNVTELLPALIIIKRALLEVAPNLHIRFVDLGPRDNALGALSEGAADFVIAASIGKYPLELHSKTLYADDFACFYDAAHRKPPTSIEDYAAAPHGVLDFGGQTKSIVDTAIDSAGFSRRLSLSASNSFALARLAEGTDVIITLPEQLKNTAFKGFAFCKPPLLFPKVRYDLVVHRRVVDSQRHRFFETVIFEAVRTMHQPSVPRA